MLLQDFENDILIHLTGKATKIFPEVSVSIAGPEDSQNFANADVQGIL
jgi:hypothetical protein